MHKVKMFGWQSADVIFALIGCVVAASALGADVYEVRENDGRLFNVSFCKERPVIDGNLDDAAWKDAPSFSGFRRHIESLPVAVENTVMQMTYDDKNLYLAIKFSEKDMKSLRAFAPCNGLHDLRDDRVEIFFNPLAFAEATPQIIIVNCRGIIKTVGESRDGWQPAIKTAHGQGADYWALEIEIPLEGLGKDNLKGEICGLNVTRMRGDGITALVPTKPGESFKNRMMKLYFDPPAQEALQITSTTRGALALDGFISGANQVQYSIRNNGNDALRLVFEVENILAGKSLGKISKEALISDVHEEVSMFYNVLGQEGEVIRFSVSDKKTGKVLYSSANTVDVLNPIYRVYRVNDPFFEPLLDKSAKRDPRRTGNMSAGTPVGYRFATFKNALKFGVEYSLDKLQQELKETDFHIYDYASWVDDVRPVTSVWKNAGQDAGGLPFLLKAAKEKGWNKPIVYANCYVTGVDTNGNPGPNVGTGFGYLFDPVNARAYVDSLENIVKKHGDQLWAVFVGDEQMEQNEMKFLAEMKKNYNESETNSYYYKINAEVKKDFGFGKFGVPFDMNWKHPDYPFCKSAFIRWMQSKIRPANREARKVVKAIHPDMPIISEDLMGGLGGDLTAFDDYADIAAFQLAEPYYTKKQPWTFKVKFVKDLGGLDYVIPCVHEITDGCQAGFSNPEESLELYSQILRGGASGLSGWFAAYPPPWPPVPYAQSVSIGHPYAWDYMVAITKTINAMPPLKFPKADSAVLVSMDSIHSQDDRYPYWTAGLQRYDDVFTQLGVNSRSWFKFVASDRILAGKEDLAGYKTVYVPDIKYTTPEFAAKLRDYCEQGGTLVCLGPDAFEYNLNAEPLTKFREEIFGVTINGKIEAKSAAFDLPGLKTSIPLLELDLNKLKLTDPGKVSVLATFDNGDPALTEKKIGKGRALYFAFMPITEATTRNEAWIKFWTDFHKAMGCSVGNDIWRFKLPAPVVASKPVPEVPDMLCLTGNHGFWIKGYFYGKDSRFNLPLQGVYTIASGIDKTGPIAFREGKLTDRLRAAEYSETLMACGLPDNHIYLQPEKWVETFKGELPVKIDFRFSKPCLVKKAALYLQGEFNGVELAVSADGKQWEKAGAEAGAFKTGEYEVRRLEIKSGVSKPVKFVRLEFGKRSLTNSVLTVAEVELWGDCPELTGSGSEQDKKTSQRIADGFEDKNQIFKDKDNRLQHSLWTYNSSCFDKADGFCEIVKDSTEGAYAMKISARAGGHGAGIYGRMLRVNPGDNVKISCSAKGRGRFQSSLYCYNADGACLNHLKIQSSLENAGAGGWKIFTHEFTVPAEQDPARKVYKVCPAFMLKPDSEIIFDDIKIEIAEGKI